MPTDYSFPNPDVLAKYLALLSRVLVDARFRAGQLDPQLAQLLDSVHNLPDLLARWPDAKEEWIEDDLRKFEERYLSGGDPYTSILRDGPRPGWQLRWTNKAE